MYRGQDLTNGRVVALKHIRLANMDDDSLEFMAREIDVLARLGSHPSVVSLLDVACGKTKSSMYLVFEYVEHDLAGLLSVAEKHSLRLGQVKRLASQLLSALAHCHAGGVMHRDVKGSNLLIYDDGTLKLADFGLARREPRGMEPLTNRVVTLWYRPPELLLGARAYDGAALDAWSAGCIIAELLHFSPILPGRTEVEQLHKIFKLCGSADAEEVVKRIELQNRALKAKKRSSGKEGEQISRDGDDAGGGLAVGVPSPENAYRRTVDEKFESFPPDALDLVQKLLVVDPLKRLTPAQALEHPFFTNAGGGWTCARRLRVIVPESAAHVPQLRRALGAEGAPNETGGGNYEHVGLRILSVAWHSPPKQEEEEAAAAGSGPACPGWCAQGETPPPPRPAGAGARGGRKCRASARLRGARPCASSTSASSGSRANKEQSRTTKTRGIHRCPLRRAGRPSPTAWWASGTSSPTGRRRGGWGLGTGGSRRVDSTRPSPRRRCSRVAGAPGLKSRGRWHPRTRTSDAGRSTGRG